MFALGITYPGYDYKHHKPSKERKPDHSQHPVAEDLSMKLKNTTTWQKS